MPNISPITNRASNALGVALPLLTSLSNPVSAAIAGGVGLIGLVDKIGQGRKAANKFTQNGGPQDIINQQLKAIAGSSASPEEKAAATERAWSGFLQAANEFAAANPKQSTVVQQAIYKTPQLTDTVKSLMGGKDPLDPSFTNMAAQGIAQGAAGRNPGPSIGGTLLNSGLSAAAPFIINGLQKGGGGNPDAGVIDPLGKGNAGNGGGFGGFLNSLFGGGGSNQKGLAGLLGTLLPVGTSLTGAILNGRAASNAANLQAGAADNAARLAAEAAKNSLDFQKQVYDDQKKANEPFLQAGTNALAQIQKLIAPGGELSKDFVAPTADEVRQTPGYQLKLDEAMKALQRGAKGVTNGAILKSGERFANDYADSAYGSAFDRALETFQTNRSNRLSPLMQLAGFGPSAVQQNTTTGNNAANNNTNINTGLANTLGNLGENSAFQRASGNVSRTNALTAALQQISNLAQQRQLLAQLGGS